MTSALAKAALWYARQGWPVFPCVPRKKTPLIKGWPALATTDLDQLWDWWRRTPDANIGLACGAAAGVYVIDVDQHGEDGEATLAQAERALGALPATVEQRTGSGGRQLFFAWPAGHDMRNKAGGSRQSLGSGVDTRGQGGFVVLPPSMHPCGEIYRWVRGQGPHERAPAQLPEAWVARLERREEPRIEVPVRRLQNVGEQRIDGLLEFLASRPAGCRNAALYWAASKVAQMYRLGTLRGTHDDDLAAAAREAGLRDHEIWPTIRSAKRSGSVE